MLWQSNKQFDKINKGEKRNQKNWIWQFGETLGSLIRALMIPMYLLWTWFSCWLSTSTPTLTVSRHFKFAKKWLICFRSLQVPKYPETVSIFTWHVDKQHGTPSSFFFFLGMQMQASPHLFVTLCTRPWTERKKHIH